MTSNAQIEFFVNAEAFVRIASLERFDETNWVGNISLRSGAFGLYGHRFYFEHLARFASDVRDLYRTLSGSARLGPTYETEFIELLVDPLGHLRLTGHFEYFDGGSQRLDIQLAADQTYLPPFIASLDAALTQYEQV